MVDHHTAKRIIANAFAVMVFALAAASASDSARVTTSPYVGAWHSNFGGARWTFTLAPSGIYTISHNGLLRIYGYGQFVAQSRSMVRESGPYACGPRQTGGYGLSLDGATLQFTKIFDFCPTRRAILVGHEFTRGR